MTNLTLVRQIGQGGFGNVDLVSDQDGQHYARKTFSQNQPLDAALLQNVIKRFGKEVRIQGGISHRNIVPVIYSDLNTYPPYYIMPVAESSLADDIQSDRTVGGNFLSAIGDIVSGLEELHNMEIYHRDLKPQNVLRFSVNGDCSQQFYAISDFGLISMRDSTLSVLTKTGMRKSSDYYTAPEIARDLKQASPQSDIYSLGCILHDMVGVEDRVPCGEIREPGDFSPIFLGCTRKDPAQRFKSVRAVLDAILSVDFSPQPPASPETVNFTDVLGAATPPDASFWGRLADFLEHSAAVSDKAAVFGKLSDDRIKMLCQSDNQAASQIGLAFSAWVSSTAFNFDHCDALANRLETFFDMTSFEVKVECLMAMLKMGTSHNRWFVEHKFARLCGPDMDDNLAKRLSIHFRIEGSEVCRLIDHLERSISFNRSSLHPAVVKALGEVCS